MLRPGFSTGVEQDRNPEPPHGMENRREGKDDDDPMKPGMGGMSGHGEEDRRRPGTQAAPPTSDPPEHERERDE